MSFIATNQLVRPLSSLVRLDEALEYSQKSVLPVIKKLSEKISNSYKPMPLDVHEWIRNGDRQALQIHLNKGLELYDSVSKGYQVANKFFDSPLIMVLAYMPEKRELPAHAIGFLEEFDLMEVYREKEAAYSASRSALKIIGLDLHVTMHNALVFLKNMKEPLNFIAYKLKTMENAPEALKKPDPSCSNNDYFEEALSAYTHSCLPPDRQLSALNTEDRAPASMSVPFIPPNMEMQGRKNAIAELAASLS